MYLPIWAIVLLGIGWLGFVWLLIRRDGERDLTAAPPMPFRPAASMPGYVGVPVDTPGDLPPERVAELRAMVAAGQKIQAIKRLRELTNIGLRESKDWIERL